MAKIVSVCNQKGGVGKTTTTINLGACLVDLGKKVLLVDLDPQGALSAGLGIAHNELNLTVYNLLMDPKLDVSQAVLTTNLPGLDILPSNIDLSAAEIQLVTEVGREHAMARVLAKVSANYDYILIDCQPSLGLLTVNALTCSESVIIPMECEYFSLRGLALLQDTVEKVSERLNPNLKIMGVLVTMYDARTLHSREVLNRVQETFQDLVFKTHISRTVKFPETNVAGEPIINWAPSSKGADEYKSLAKEFVARIDG